MILQSFFGHVFATQGPDRLRIVGSTALYGFSTAVAERFGKLTPYKTPLVEANGTGGGFRIFCQSGLKNGPDAVNASRPIESSERIYCSDQGIDDIREFLVGYDGIVIAAHQSSLDMMLTSEDLFKALAKVVLINGQWIENPHKFWSDINPKLPNKKINLLGPPPSSGTYSILIDHILKAHCPIHQSKCVLIRDDGVYIQASEHENVVVQKLLLNPEKLGIFSFSFLKSHKHDLKAIPIDGYLPSQKTIMDKSYALSRGLYIYAREKTLKDKPQLLTFIQSFIEANAVAERGYLKLKGFVPLNTQDRDRVGKFIIDQ